MTLNKILSIERKSFKYKLMLAYVLMSIVPNMVLFYIVTTYVYVVTDDFMPGITILLFTCWVSLLGYVLIKQTLLPVFGLSLETRIISEGRGGFKGASEKGGELVEIAAAVNTMTGKIRSYISELQEYSKKTTALNARIHRKVLTLTNLMRLGDMISTGSGYEEVSSFAAEKISGEMDRGYCMIYLREGTGSYSLKTFYNNSRKDLPEEALAKELPAMERLFARHEYLLLDSRPAAKPWQKEFRDKVGLKNVILFPMNGTERITGIIVAGNFSEEYEFGDDEIGVIKAYQKELVMGQQSSRAMEKGKGIDVIDSMTGLYTREFLEERLEDEINRAVYYQRPCSLIILNIDEFEKYAEHHGGGKCKSVLKLIAQLLTELSSPVGKAARFDYDEFAVLLPERNKRESIDIAEKIRVRISSMDISGYPEDRVTVSLGVGENPIDGTNAEEIIAKAYANLGKAKARGKNKVVGE